MAAQEDKAKAIDGLRACEWLMQSQNYCMKQGCPYLEHRHNGDCLKVLHDDVLDMLKAQEPVEPIMRRVVFEHDAFSEAENKMYCPKCKMELLTRVNYCPWCGQAVKWE